MNAEITLGIAFTIGILGSLHCIGMCCGINGGYFVHAARHPGPWPIVAFHAMRIAAYVLLGIVGALLGRVLVQSGIVGKAQGLLMIFAGVLVIVLGVRLSGVFSRLRTANKHDTRLGIPVISLHRQTTLLSPIAVGLLNGMVPCSLVFSVAVKATSTADPVDAGLLMLSFGLGTLPAMLALSLFSRTLAMHLQGRVPVITGAVVGALGLWTLYEGVVFYDVMRGLANW